MKKKKKVYPEQGRRVAVGIPRSRFTQTRNRLRVAVGLSGGVDSAVAAALLKEQGYEVTGVHLFCWDKGPYCTANKDRASALRVAKHLDIPFIVWDLRKEYKKKVIDYFFDEYRRGRTPNPDVMCNREIKFGIFMEKALKELKVDKVATGHYTRIKEGKLLRGVDESKDQSYFLWILTPKQLEYIIFPIGHMTKEEVRAKARELNLPCAERPDSQGICFIGPVNVAKFLREHLPIEPGSVVNKKGEVIGEHDGAWFYTEGQRRGLRFTIPRSGIAKDAKPSTGRYPAKQTRTKPSYPLYVIKKDLEKNTLVVGRGKEAEVKEFKVGEINWINDKPPVKSSKAGVRIRHLGEIMSAKIQAKNGKSIGVKLNRSTHGIAPGQSAVFYQKDEVLGGGVIERIHC